MSEEIRRAYATLGLPFGASRRELRRQYKRLVKTWHPDRFASDPAGQSAASERMSQINRAYRLLLDSQPARLLPQEESPTEPAASARAWTSSSRLGRDEIDRMVRAIGTQSPVDWVIGKLDWLVWPLDSGRAGSRPMLQLVVGLMLGALLIAVGMKVGVGAHVTSTLVVAFLFIGSLYRRVRGRKS